MRRSDREVTDLGEILGIVRRAEFCTLALGGDYPYAVPLSFGECYENGVLTLYFHGASEGEKLTRIARDPRAGFSLVTGAAVRQSVQPCGCTTSFESVIGYGAAALVADRAERERGLSLLLHHYGYTGEPAFDEKVMEHTVVFKLTAERFTAKRHE
ncbi:MAG: pyridoxamine 5'-phosphate oxidase family protein [Bacteroides sp.]|nr:pyridoxamine 5'-phosphate oxidase family protein [Eubacterium sp.]MCM1418498.1 pyridoxamine 5'-phosphate oxidase family protein [Roseburia sp.]MCM1462517.1 pyridoxamine 5'-phosphate oxidase family protein [Bacteroides sp.]